MKYFLSLCIIALCSVSASAQYPENGSFEETEITVNDTLPTGWTTTLFGSKIDPVAHSGKNAVTIWNWYCDAQGILAWGTSEPVPTGRPIDFRPNIISGYYKYILGDNGGKDDSAVVRVILTKYNAIKNAKDTLRDVIYKLGAAAEFTPFYLNFDPNLDKSVPPDTCSIVFYSSEKGFCAGNTDCNCCYLTVDDVGLFYAMEQDVTRPEESKLRNAYPNPFTNFTFFGTSEANNTTLRIFTETGALIKTLVFAQGESMSVDHQGLASGAYFYEIAVPGKEVVRGKVVRQ